MGVFSPLNQANSLNLTGSIKKLKSLVILHGLIYKIHMTNPETPIEKKRDLPKILKALASMSVHEWKSACVQRRILF